MSTTRNYRKIATTNPTSLSPRLAKLKKCLDGECGWRAERASTAAFKRAVKQHA